MIVGGLLWGIEASICYPDLESWEACCLSGAWIWAVAERAKTCLALGILSLFLLMHVGTNDNAKVILSVSRVLIEL